MDDISDRLAQAMATFEDIADHVTAHEAADTVDSATLQMFWKHWPHVSKWAGGLWRQLNDDLAAPSDYDVGHGE